MKRDRALLRGLLGELQLAPRGSISIAPDLNPSEEVSKRLHHLELMIDQGMVTRPSQYSYRLTSLGHDAAEALEQNETWAKLETSAPKEAYELLKTVGTSLAVAALSKLMGWN